MTKREKMDSLTDRELAIYYMSPYSPKEMCSACRCMGHPSECATTYCMDGIKAWLQSDDDGWFDKVLDWWEQQEEIDCETI